MISIEFNNKHDIQIILWLSAWKVRLAIQVQFLAKSDAFAFTQISLGKT